MNHETPNALRSPALPACDQIAGPAAVVAVLNRYPMNAFRVDYRAYHMDGGSVFVENVIVDAVDMLGHATIRKRLGSALVKSTCDVSELARTPGKALGKFSAIVARLASRPLLDDVAGKTDAERATMAAKTAHLTAPGPDRSNLNVAGKTDSGALTQPETATA